MQKLIHIVAAVAENLVIGRDGRLPWRISGDLEHFQELTAGNVCVLGRVCFDTWPDAIRGGRQPIVLTSHPLPTAQVDLPRSAARAAGDSAPMRAHSLPEALAIAETIPGEIFVCGGEKIFTETLALNRPMRLHLTLVHAEVPGDRFFPDWRKLRWREIDRDPRRDANFFYTFLTLERVW